MSIKKLILVILSLWLNNKSDINGNKTFDLRTLIATFDYTFINNLFANNSQA